MIRDIARELLSLAAVAGFVAALAAGAVTVHDARTTPAILEARR